MSIRSPIIVTVGHSDHGKCVAPDTLIPLADGRILSAEELFNEYANGRSLDVKDGIVVESNEGPEIFSLGRGGNIERKKITHFWKLKNKGNLINVKLKSGDEVMTTPDHPFFVMDSELNIFQKKAKDIEIGDFVVVPRKLHFSSNLDTVKNYVISRLEKMENFLLRLNLDKSKHFIERLKSENIQDLKRRDVFSIKDPYTCILENRFRARDLISLAKFFGFTNSEIYDMIDEIKNASEKWRVGHTSNWMRIPHDEEDFGKLGYVLGCLAGDGYINEGILNKNDKDVQEAYRKAVKEALNLDSKIVQGHTCEYIVTSGGLTFERFLMEVCLLPSSNKAENIQLPLGFQTFIPFITGFIKGWFDTDGYVSFLNNSIEITSKSRNIVQQVGIWLLAFGIHSCVTEKYGYHILRIANKPYVGLFLQHFRPKSERKFVRIRDAASKSGTSRIFDMTPFSGNSLKKFGLSETYNYWYKNRRNLSRSCLERVLQNPRNNSSNISEKIRGFLESELSVVKVVSKREVGGACDFVYDFTVPDNHNFIANRIIIHNTTLLDRIRGTSVTKTEVGQLTQHTGASYVPLDVIEKISGKLMQKFKIKLEVPGLLFIDTPGHKAFLGMRKRGGAVSDLAILVVDLTEGFQEQTVESLNVLKEFKTPFVVAATKVDKLRGWFAHNNSSFLESFEKQREDVKEDLENAVYKIVSQLGDNGFSSERFDRVDNFSKQIAIVPLSSMTGEGIPDLLMVLSGLAQHFLKDKLKISEKSLGSVLEVKEVRGLGKTIDVILYDGKVSRGDFAVIGGKEIIVTRIKALLVPRSLQELRVEKQFQSVDSVTAATGIKIAAPGLENVVAGSPIIFVRDEAEIANAKREIRKETESVQIERQIEGAVLRADTLGSLEALIKILSEENMPIRKAEIGPPSRQDIIELQNIEDETKRVIISFNVRVPVDVEILAKDLGIKIFSGEVIYRIVDEYKDWVKKLKEAEYLEKISRVTRPCEIKVLKGTVFRQSDPAVFGVEVLRGVLKPGVQMMKGKKVVDRIKEIQKEGKPTQEVKKGEKAAVSMQNVVVGRHVKEGDVLSAKLSENDLEILKEIFDRLGEDEKELIGESTRSS